MDNTDNQITPTPNKDELYLQQLHHEIQEFEKEKERLRKVMGDLGGTRYSSKEAIVNIIFGIIVVLLLVVQFIFKWIPAILSVELAVFLVSIKIIWMIYAQQKHNHFLFWVLNTIEYRINDTYKLLKIIQKNLDAKQGDKKKKEKSSNPKK